MREGDVPSEFFARILQSWTVTSEAAFYLALLLVMLALTLVSRHLRAPAARAAALAVVERPAMRLGARRRAQERAQKATPVRPSSLSLETRTG